MAVLSHVPGTVENNPLSHEEAVATKKILDALDGTERLLIHGRVHPNVPGEMERMDTQAASARLAGFKTYTQFGPADGPGGYRDEASASDFALKRLAPGVALLTYRTASLTDSGPRQVWRSSIWRVEGGKGQIVFHQGTPTAGT